MVELAELAVIGLALGAVYALLGLGVSIVHRASRIPDFASVGAGTAAALLHWDLVSARGHFPEGLGYWPALALSLSLAVLLGAVSERLLRPLAGRPGPAIVGSLAWGTTLLAGAVLVFGADPRYLEPVWAGGPLRLGALSLPRQPLAVGGLTAAAFLVTGLALRSGRFGLALRAVEADRDGARMAGVDLASVARRSWMLGSALQSACLVLVLPPALSNPYSTLLFLPFAFATALAGGFRRLGRMALGAAVLGVLPRLVDPTGTLTGVGGIQNLVAFLVILALLLTRPARGIDPAEAPPAPLGPGPGAAVPRPAPGWHSSLTGRPALRRLLGGLVALALVAGVPLLVPDDGLRAVAAALALALVAASAVVTAWSGQVGLAQAAFAGVGAYAVGALSVRLAVPDAIAVPLAVATAVPLAVLVGLPGIRRRGPLPLAVASLGLVLAASSMLWQAGPAWTDGGRLGDVAPTGRWAGPIAVHWTGRSAYLVALILVVAVVWFAGNVSRSRSGRALRTVGDDERAAAICGIDPARARLVSLALTGTVASLGGVLHAYVAGPLDPLRLLVVAAAQLLFCAVLGGARSLVPTVAVALALELTAAPLGGGTPGLPSAWTLLALSLLALGAVRGIGARWWPAAATAGPLGGGTGQQGPGRRGPGSTGSGRLALGGAGGR